MKIYVKVKNSFSLPNIIEKGDWIDLAVPVDTKIYPVYTVPSPTKDGTQVLKAEVNMIDLGVAMQLPKGFEAVVLPRSSTFKKHRILLGNSQGVIDNSFSGEEDWWKFPAILFKSKTITLPAGTRIAQFRIQLSQKATIWQKLKWLFSNKIEIVQTNKLSNISRGGFGSTGD